MSAGLPVSAPATLALALGLALGQAPAQSQSAELPPVRLSTWHPWQLDSLAVAWVVAKARPVAPVFESVPRGTPLAAEAAIDTPDSPYRRSAQRTAFDEAVRLERLDHPCVPRLREAVRVIELAPWRKADHPEAEALEARVLARLPTVPQRGGIEPALAEIERFCTPPPTR